ncbi:MAG: ATP-binding protein [Bacteroidota bacterium]|nr:ATP-binding protein [Bacteroidota bacterium]
MFISREIYNELLESCRTFPVVTITGPRQSGKTTLLKNVFPEKKYVSLEDPDIRQMATSDPRAFLNQSDSGLIIDEIQRVPELVSYIQGIVDKLQIPGYYILSGSQQFELSQTISQSLAGRTALLRLLPFSLHEIQVIAANSTIDELIFQGFYPRIYNQPTVKPARYYSSYLETYIERDLRQLINVKDLRQFELFVRLCAGRVGQIFVASNLANEVGVSVPTIQSWLSILEASYIVYLLQPFYANINKRLTKSPKLYFYDVGLAAFLTGINESYQILTSPLKGPLFENLVVMEALKSKYNHFKLYQLCYYRDSNNNEVDLILDYTTHLDALEIKSSQTFDKSFLKGLNYLRGILPEKIRNTKVCYSGEMEQMIDGTKLVNFKNIFRE